MQGPEQILVLLSSFATLEHHLFGKYHESAAAETIWFLVFSVPSILVWFLNFRLSWSLFIFIFTFSRHLKIDFIFNLVSINQTLPYNN